MTRKELFFKRLAEKETLPEALRPVFEQEKSGEDFWNLCKQFAMTGIQAQKIRMEDGSIQHWFSNESVKNAANATSKFIEKYSVNACDDLFELIKELHSCAVEHGTKHQSDFIPGPAYGSRKPGDYGTYVRKAMLPDNIFQNIIDEVRKERNAE